MKIRLPPFGESSMRRSTRTEGPSVEKRCRYSSADEGGMNRSRRETLMLAGGTTGWGEDGTEVLSASWWPIATTALEKTFDCRLK